MEKTFLVNEASLKLLLQACKIGRDHIVVPREVPVEMNESQAKAFRNALINFLRDALKDPSRRNEIEILESLIETIRREFNMPVRPLYGKCEKCGQAIVIE